MSCNWQTMETAATSPLRSAHESLSIADAVAQMGDGGALDDRDRSFQLDRGVLQLVEEGDPPAQQDRDR